MFFWSKIKKYITGWYVRCANLFEYKQNSLNTFDIFNIQCISSLISYKRSTFILQSNMKRCDILKKWADCGPSHKAFLCS